MFQGSMVALVTPMKASGALDIDALRHLVEWHCDAGTDAIVVAGSTGEAATLSPADRTALIRETVAQVKGRIPVIAGTGTNSSQSTVELTQQAKAEGVDGVLVCTPYYNRPTQDGMIAHFTAAADVGVPLILYNIPPRTAIDLLPETVLKLSEHPSIVAIKESHSLERCLTLLERCPDDFDIISGDDANALACIEAGGVGVISVVANIMPDLMHACIEAALSDDMAGAKQLETRMKPLYTALFVETNPIPVKYCLSRMGKIHNTLRLPLTSLSPSHQAFLDDMLIDLGVAHA